MLFQLLGILWLHIRFLKIGTESAAWPWRHPAEMPVLRQPWGPTSHCTTSRSHASLNKQFSPGSSTSSLRILDLHGVSGIAVRKILGVHAPHLRSLRLLHFSLDSVAFLRQCTRLEELVIYNLPVFVPLAPELPPSIEHLPFRNPRHAFKNMLRPILDTIEVLPKLRIQRVYGSSRC